MPRNDRWTLYHHWLEKYVPFEVKRLHELCNQYHVALKEYDEIRKIKDTWLMKRDMVVGMTTTCAARLWTCLQSLKCPIVVIEEAAEVLESHVLTSLTKDCQHLILIGDHQQLRPSTADYNMEKNMKLGISLFERMVMNKLDVSVLGKFYLLPVIISYRICNAYNFFDWTFVLPIENCSTDKMDASKKICESLENGALHLLF